MAVARLGATVLGSPDPRALADFYQALTGFERYADEPGWVRIGPAGDVRPSLSFQLEESFAAPVWPTRSGEQQLTVHLDLLVDDVSAAVARAVALGATQHPHQPADDAVVLTDPQGHVFCLFALAP